MTSRKRTPRIFIPVLIVAGPDQPRFGGFVEIDEEDTLPSLLAFEVSDQRLASVFEELDSLEPLLGLEDFLRLGGERRLQGHNAVAIRHGVSQIAFVQRLRPDQRGGVRSLPHGGTRTCGNARQSYAFLQGLARDLALDVSGLVPDFDFLRKRSSGQQIGEGTVNRSHQEVIAIWRDADRFDDSRLANGRHLAGCGIDHRKLRRRVKLKHILVVRILQHVLESGGPGCAAETFLNVRSRGNHWFGRRSSTIRLGDFDEQGLTVGHPLNVGSSFRVAAEAAASSTSAATTAAAHHAVDMDTLDFVSLAGSSVADPQINGVRGGIRKSEVGPIGTPMGCPQLWIGRKVNFDLRSFRNLSQSQGSVEDCVMQAVGLRVDAQACETQHGPR